MLSTTSRCLLAITLLGAAFVPSAVCAEDRTADVTARLLQSSLPPGGTATVGVTVTPGKGVKLYRDQISVSVSGRSTASVSVSGLKLPAGHKKYDELLGKQVEFYSEPVQFNVSLKLPAEVRGPSLSLVLEVAFQGCTETTCFPPESSSIPLVIPVSSDSTANRPAPESSPPVSGTEPQPKGPAGDTAAGKKTWAERAIESGGWLSIIGAFVAGLVVAFTPCVYPMIPVTVALIGGAAGSGEKKPGRPALVLYTLVYVFGISTTYALLGVVAALAGDAMTSYMEHPATLAVVALVMAALSLSMFGAFDLKLPGAITAGLGRFQGAGSLPMLLVSGLVMGLVASPCVSAPLAALFVAMAKTGNVIVGGLSLFAFGWGMSALLLVAGIFPGLLSRPGAWMDTVKYVFAVVLAAFGIYFARDLIPAALFQWRVVVVAAAAGVVLLLVAGKVKASSIRIKALVTGIAGIALVLSAYLLLGFAYRTGGLDYVLPPAAHPPRSAGLPWQRYSPQGIERAGKAGRPVMLYFRSDNCYYCKKLKNDTFPDPRIVEESKRFLLLEANLSWGDESVSTKGKELSVRGVPAIFLYGASGKLTERVVGFLDADALLAKMKAVR